MIADHQDYLLHVASVEEVGWGIALIAVTMTIHAFGMIVTLATGDAMQKRLLATQGFFNNVPILVVTSWVIVFVHLAEVAVWACFFVWRDAMPTMTAAYYYALLQYVTVGSELMLPVGWRLLGGMIGMAGLLTFAWSTTVLLTLAQRFEDKQLKLLALRRRRDSATKAGPASGTEERIGAASQPPSER